MGTWTTRLQGIPVTVNIISVWNLLSSIITRDDRSDLPLALSKRKDQREKKFSLLDLTTESVIQNAKCRMNSEQLIGK
jgi:hypothetical protein